MNEDVKNNFVFENTEMHDKGPTSVNPHMVLVVGGTGERPSTAGLGAEVRPLSRMCTDVNFANVGGGKRPATAFNWALERLFSLRHEVMDKETV